MTITDTRDVEPGDAYRTEDGDEYRVVETNSIEALVRNEAGASTWVTKTEVRERIADGRLEPADQPDKLLTADPNDLVGKTIDGRHANGDRENGVITRVSDTAAGRALEVKTGDDWTTMIYPKHGEWEVIE